ncbi:MAG: MFS transporter, partial [Clostridia bacterium]|nr:MFS transporter [Clostridia bacterium]
MITNIMQSKESKDLYKTSRILYIIEASLEYFISLLVTGAYLAKVTEAIGLSDTLTGILTSFVSLGCGFQIIAIFLANKRPVKRWVTVLHSVNQLFFALIYLIPFIDLTKTQKTVLFVLFLLVGHIINNVVNSPKINWFMSLVDDHKRGSFTASKEMVSLIGGMVFSFAMGAVIDRFEMAGDLNGAFIVCGISVFVLMLLHSATLIFSKEKESSEEEKISTKQLLIELIKDKNLFKVILISVLWNVVNYVATPFYGSYQIKELGFSMTFVSALSAGYAIVRTIFSKPMGKFADKYSFAKMLNICFVVMLVAFGFNVFTVPENGKVLYTIYYMLNAVGMAGINSATINLIYDYVDKEKRVGALALKSTLAGFAGFFTTLAVSPLVSHIQ